MQKKPHKPDFAVFGNPIKHSLSPQIHQYFSKITQIPLVYEKILGDLTSFEDQVRFFFEAGGRGLNITAPFKERAFRLSSTATDYSIQAEAANTLWIKDGALAAANTDGLGLICDLKRHLDLEKKNILILGAGGAARGIIMPLWEQKPLSITVANRSQDKVLHLKKAFPFICCATLKPPEEAYDLIINACTANTQLDLADQLFKKSPFCYDLNYQQGKDSPFLAQAKIHACSTKDGLGMLIEQAALAFCIWHGIHPPTETLYTELKK